VREDLISLLHERGIYELNSCGRSGPDDHDDEMIGRAMWQTGSLSFRFLDAHFSGAHAHGLTLTLAQFTPPSRVPALRRQCGL
jgi:hypothetical protein